jgi:predicted metal-dependent phosphoesterase TrpH
VKADLHLHTWFSHDCDVSPKRLVRRCQEVRLNCIAITDHNSTRGAFEVRELAPFTVIVGEEVSTTEGEIIGLFLQEPIPRGLTPIQTVRHIRAQGGLVLVPHPYDRWRRGPLSENALHEVLRHTDIIESFNSRVISKQDLQQSLKLAIEARLPHVASSDAHTLGEIGLAHTEFDGFDGTPQSFHAAIARGRVSGRQSPLWVHAQTAWVKLKKRLPGQQWS